MCVSVWGSYFVSPNIEDTVAGRGSEETEEIGRQGRKTETQRQPKMFLPCNNEEKG